MVSSKSTGFSLLELMITVSIGLVLAGIGYIAFRPLLSQADINSAYDTTLMALRNTRNLAITQSHEYYVFFNPVGFPAGTIEVEYQPPAVGAGAAPPLQQVITYTIPSDVSFTVQAGFPGNTPDGFGTGVNAIDFGQALAGEPMNYVVFMPDGSAQDNLGNFNSGIIYLTRPGDNVYVSSRAITVWGATGRIRGWRLGQTAGVGAWVQQ
ncbi:MAG: prepilin-type N-terminal cleavage/methylation domain-containing protein [Candidatus Sulfotelmatobacter sp.]